MKAAFLLLTLIAAISCSSATLDAIETTAEKLQPIVDGTRELCGFVYECDCAGSCDMSEAQQKCRKIEAGWRAYEKAQDLLIIAAGGEPCGNSCQK